MRRALICRGGSYILAAVLGCTVVGTPLRAAPPTSEQLDASRALGLKWLLTHQASEGSWAGAPGLEVQSTAAVLDGLGNAGVKRAPAYVSGLGFLNNARAGSNDAVARQLAALARAGENVSGPVSTLLAARDALFKGWGSYPQDTGNALDTALALDALRVAGATDPSTSAALGFVINRQNGDGGWSYAAPEPNVASSRLVPTAFNVRALARYKPQGWNVDSNIRRASIG